MDSADHEAGVVVAPPPIQQTSHNKPRLSKRRWLLLMGICVFGFLNGFVNEMTAILSTLTDLLGLQLDEYVYISQVFNYIKPLAALPSAWFVDKFGIRNTMYLALVLAIVRNSSRALLFYSPAPMAAPMHDKHEALTSLKFLYWTLSSVSESLTIVVYFTCLPLRISESWFPKEERSFAWSSIYMVPFMGASLAAFVLPRLIVGPQSNHLLAELNLACLLVSVFAVILTCDRSRPQEAPSARSFLAEQQLKRAHFFKDLKNVLSFQFILQLMITCGFEAMSASIKSVFQDVLCATLGLPQVFCGNLLALNSLVMIIMQLIGSWHMDKRKQQQHQDSRREQYGAGAESTGVKLLASLQWLTFVFHLSCLSAGSVLRANQWWLVVVSMLLHSAASSWAAPYYNDTLANLITGRLSQATTSAVRLAFYIMLNNPFQSLFVFLRQVDTTSGQASYALSMAFAALMMTSMTVVYVCCFRGAATVAEATPAGSVDRLEPASDDGGDDDHDDEETNSARQR